MPYLPCENPDCKSFGKSHINCRCFGPAGNKYSKGGKVERYCSGPHKANCQYFQEAGDVINPDNVAPDTAAPEINPDEVDAGQQINAAHVVTGEPPQSNAQATIGNLEAASQGVFGFLSPLVETKVFGVDPKDIAQRKANEAFYGEHKAIETAALIGSLVTPGGPMKGAISLIGHAVPEAVLASRAISTFLQGASFGASDEITKNILGQGGSPADTAAHVLISGAGGIATGKLFNVLGAGPLSDKGIAALAEGSKDFLNEMAEKAAAKPVSKLASNAASAALATEVAHSQGKDGLSMLTAQAYTAIRAYAGNLLDKVAGKALTKSDKYVGDAILKVLSTGKYAAIPTAIKLGTAVAKGAQSSLPAIESVMMAGAAKIVPPAQEFLKDTLKSQVENGTLQKDIQDNSQSMNEAEPPAEYAKGGAVTPQNNTDHLAEAWPEQAMILNSAKARIHTYLNSIRPSPTPGQAFDDVHKDKDRERSYHQALDLAVNPLSILNHVNQSTLTPELMQHMVSLHPEVHGLLSKKLMERVVKAQLDGKKPPYSKRQSMSLFLGKELDGVLMPMAIQTAQAVFTAKQAMQQQQQAGPKKPTKSKASLSKLSGSALTQEQAREQRAQKV